MDRHRPWGLAKIGIAVAQLPAHLAELTARAVRDAGAEPVWWDTEHPAGDGIIHGYDLLLTRRIERLLESSRRPLGLPVLLLAPDCPPLRRLLDQCPDRKVLTWLPAGEGGETYDLSAAVCRHVQRSVAAHTLRLAAAGLPPQVQRLTRAFLMAVLEERQPPALGSLCRRSGVSLRTAERLWSRAGESKPKRFMDRALLLLLAVESARTGKSVTRVAKDVHIGPATLRRLRQRVPDLQSVRDLYDEPGLAALAREVTNARERR